MKKLLVILFIFAISTQALAAPIFDELKEEINMHTDHACNNWWLRAPGFGTSVIENPETHEITVVVSLVFDPRNDERKISELLDIYSQVGMLAVMFHNQKLIPYIDMLYVSAQSWYDGAITDEYMKEFIVPQESMTKIAEYTYNSDWVRDWVTIKDSKTGIITYGLKQQH